MAKKVAAKEPAAAPRQKPSALVDTRVIYCGDNLDQLQKLPDACVDLIYIDPPFNSNRNYEIFWPETSEKRRFDDWPCIDLVDSVGVTHGSWFS